MSETSLARAEGSVATRFSRIMKATTSPLGVLTDPAIVALATALAFVFLLASMERGASPLVVRVAQVLLALPLVTATLVTLALSGARARVIKWLAGLPFEVINMNAVLNGVGDEIVVRFAGALPTAAAVNADLDRIHPEVFVTGTAPEEQSLEIRIGVVDSKRNPAKTNHERYRRVSALIEGVLVPLHATHEITDIRIK